MHTAPDIAFDDLSRRGRFPLNDLRPLSRLLLDDADRFEAEPPSGARGKTPPGVPG